MKRGRVFVETTGVAETGKIIRIFRSSAAWRNSVAFKTGYWKEYSRKNAVTEIRGQIWERCKGYCEGCGNTIARGQMHMHERVSRGAGGEISLENSEGICYDCHQNPGYGRHRSRQLNFNSGTGPQ